MKEETEQDKMRRFLMGDMSDDQRCATEERFLADNQFFEHLCSLQEEIIDDYVREKLYNPQARIYDYMDQNAVQSIVNGHLEGRQNKRLLIWSLLCLEHWCQLFL